MGRFGGRFAVSMALVSYTLPRCSILCFGEIGWFLTVANDLGVAAAYYRKGRCLASLLGC